MSIGQKPLNLVSIHVQLTGFGDADSGYGFGYLVRSFMVFGIQGVILRLM